MIHNESIIRTPEEQEAERSFVRAGHGPENPKCDHREYDYARHGRYCPCGTCMMDYGD